MTTRKRATHAKNMHGTAVQSKTVYIHVTKADIEAAECGNPNNCMIKVAAKRALNLAHGYISVDATGIAITRNGLYREKAFLPRSALPKMIAFDADKATVKPFSFKVTFFKTSKIRKYDAREVAMHRRSAIKTGNAKKKYNMRSRVIGLAVGGVASAS